MKALLFRWLDALLNFHARRKNQFPSGPNIKVDASFQMGKFRHVDISTTAHVAIQDGVSFREFCNVIVTASANLSIGKNVFFNNYCSINCLGKIDIGDSTIFGEGVKIYDHNHKHRFEPGGILNVERQQFTVGKITIGKNCWIASNVTILNNVEIGDNVIVGANNLIWKSVPPNSIIKAKSEFSIEHHG